MAEWKCDFYYFYFYYVFIAGRLTAWKIRESARERKREEEEGSDVRDDSSVHAFLAQDGIFARLQCIEPQTLIRSHDKTVDAMGRCCMVKLKEDFLNFFMDSFRN